MNRVLIIVEGPYETEGKWIEYPLRIPGKQLPSGTFLHVKLAPDNSTQEFRDCYCAFGTNHLHSAVAVYRVLRELKRRKLLNVNGFESVDI